VGVECRIPKTQEALVGNNLLSLLPHLLARRTNGRKPLIDYSQSHVVTLKYYLTIMWQMAMNREAIKLIRETRRKEKQDKQAKNATTSMTTAEWVAEGELTRQQ
jgi:hypothetical protein